MRSERLVRAVKLLNLLQSGHGATPGFLAQALGCSRRTVFRELRLLNDSNVAVTFDKDLGAYRTVADQELTSSELDEDEYVSLLVAAALSPIARLDPFREDANQAIAKLARSASSSIRSRANRILRAIIPDDLQPAVTPGKMDVFVGLLSAIESRRKTDITFANDDGELFTRQFAPYRLAAQDGAWWTLGQIDRQADSLELAVDRIKRGGAR